MRRMPVLPDAPGEVLHVPPARTITELGWFTGWGSPPVAAPAATLAPTSALKNRPQPTDPYACPLPAQAPDPTGAMATFPTAAAPHTAKGGSSR
jgi:hypothetical protein